jgi:asparagine synthetase B (glutamine-hydrolysing)
MMSSGKDSSAVALALAEGGFKHVRCVTYGSGTNDPEPPIAAGICRRLGLDHEIIPMPTNPDRTAEALVEFFEASASPGVDLSQLPYVFATMATASAQGAVIDGGGNDSYMGYPVTGHGLTKLRYRVRGRLLSNAVGRAVPVDSPLNYLARSRAAATFPGRTMRIRESRKLYPSAVDTSRWWYDVSRKTRHLDLLDLYGEVMVRHADSGQWMQKQRLAANAIGLGSSLPWCDDDIADYYFNLPEHHRYDRKSGTNKILLRRMLYRYLDYDADVIGKHYFGFDGTGFIQNNMDFVRSEIDRCALWDRGGLSNIHKWLDEVDARPFLHHSLLTLFMVSGWHNHNRFLNRDPVDGASSDASAGPSRPNSSTTNIGTMGECMEPPE